jgi:hypothetical protein
VAAAVNFANWAEAYDVYLKNERPVPPGTYDVKVTKADVGESKAKGDPQISLAMIVLTGPEANRGLRTWITMGEDPNVLGFAFRKLACLGFAPDQLGKLGGIEEGLHWIAGQVVGRQVRVKVKPPVDGGRFPTVDIVDPIPGGTLSADPTVRPGPSSVSPTPAPLAQGPPGPMSSAGPAAHPAPPVAPVPPNLPATEARF